MAFFKRAGGETAASIQLIELEGMVAAIHRAQAVIEFQLDGTIITANENFLRTLGYDLSEIQGRPHRMFVEPAYAASPAYADFWRRLNAGEFLSDKFLRIGKGGRKIWIQAVYNPIFDRAGKVVRVVKFATDITQVENERIAREAASQSEEQQNIVVTTLADNLRRLAQGDLTACIDVAFEGRYDQIKADFNDAVASLRDTMGAITASTATLQSGSDEIAQASDDLSRRTEQQAASLEETAAALDQLTATVRKSADGAGQASSLVSTTRDVAQHSGQVVRQAVSAMGEIEKSSGQIAQIIGVIDEIAFQTNLLALNAGVEAARAGDAGRGFAVVAQEVRALAQRSAEAAKEIKGLISTSTSQVGAGVKLVGETGEALKRIVERVGEIDALVSEIAASSQEQATGLNQVNTAVNQMDQVTQQNAAMVEQATAASHSLKSECQELVRLVSRFGAGEVARRLPQRAQPHLAGPGDRQPYAPPVVTARKRLAALIGGGGGAAQAQPDTWEEF
jgi:methyl-accepting chemotaxis protein